ncbi:hypothetical protein [Phytobacter diazotrophicus]|uniref:hypothetical protein n=1 Tax=Phytobacter diazotrophicus TaxID=395631 RepID=UPI00293541E6|nr:hypothetical protein [Phytobacter diazotrophicus]MDV2871374.1 hypothetical protein [Phytobacter diazotrophicus]
MSNGKFPTSPVSNAANSSVGGGPQMNGMTYRQLLVAQITPVCVNHFLNDVDWEDYDDMAGSIMMMVDVIIAAERETSK